MSLQQMVEERDRLWEETRHYYGVEHFSLRDTDPMKYERFYSRIHSVALASREVARHLAANPGAREMGEAVWAVLTPEGDTLAMSLGFISHTAAFPVAIRYMAANAYDERPNIKDGDVFSTDDGLTGGAPHPGDTYNYVAIKVGDEIVGWAAGLNHIMEAGGAQAGGWPTFCADTFADGLVFPPMKTGENLTQSVWIEKLWERRTRAGALNILDDKMRTAGCAIIHKGIQAIIQEFGLDYYKRAIREVIEESRRMIMDNINTLMVPGTYNGCAFRPVVQKGLQTIWTSADRDFLLHIHACLEVRADGGIHVDMEGTSRAGAHSWNGYPGGANCALYLSMTNTFVHNTKCTAAINLAVSTHYPKGCLYNPENGTFSYSNIWGSTVGLNGVVFSMLNRSQFMHGYLEEAFTPDGSAEAVQGGGALADGTPYGFANFEYSGGASRGAFCYRDGQPVTWAAWTALTNIGNAEDFEYLIPPFFYLGRKTLPGFRGHGKFEGGAGSASLQWIVEPGRSLEVSRVSCSTSMTTDLGVGMNGAYPGPGNFFVTARGTNLKEVIAKGGKTPRDAVELLEFVRNGQLKVDNLQIWKHNGPPLDMHEDDLYANAGGASGGWGDPFERKLELVIKDLNDETVTAEFAAGLYGVIGRRNAECQWELDQGATDRRRAEIRARRKQAVPVSQWWKSERQKVLNKEGWIEPVADMYRSSMSFPKFDREMRGFWQLPSGFQP